MGLEDPVALHQLRAPAVIYLVHRTQWDKYFTYRKWRCDERTDLMGAHTTLEGAHIAVAKDFKVHVEARFPRWVPELRKEQKDRRIDEWAAEEQFTYINQFMAEKKMEDKQVDVGWTYNITQTTLSPIEKKRKLNSEMTGDEEIVNEEAVKVKVRVSEKLLLLENEESRHKDNRCVSCQRSGSRTGAKRFADESYRFATERRSLGYFCQE